MQQSDSISELSASLVAAQHVLKNPAKDSMNPFFKSRYADLGSVRDAVVPALAQHGLAVTQLPCVLDGQPALCTQLVHVSGEWIRATMLLNAAKVDPQGMGSAITYARRYALQAIAGVTAEEDDDGNAGSNPQQAKPAQPKPQAPKQTAAHVTTAQLAEELKRMGLKWADCIHSINSNAGEQKYQPTARFSEVDPNDLDGYYHWIRLQMPNQGGNEDVPF